MNGPSSEMQLGGSQPLSPLYSNVDALTVQPRPLHMQQSRNQPHAQPLACHSCMGDSKHQEEGACWCPGTGVSRSRAQLPHCRALGFAAGSFEHQSSGVVSMVPVRFRSEALVVCASASGAGTTGECTVEL